jgi:UTP--glucose-1-phosphate uridylyltransferase
MKVKNAVILAAGLNSRMMPIAKTIPKCLYPLGNKPLIHYLVEECVQSGIEKIVIVVRKDHGLIENYFSKDQVLEDILSGRGKKEIDALEKLKEVDRMAEKIKYAVQVEALGECHALYQARKEVNNEPFALLYGDYQYVGKVPATKQLIEVFKKKPRGMVEADARYIFDERAFTFLGEMDFLKLDLESLYPLVAKYPKEEVRDVLINGTKCDVGSPEEYWKTLKFMRYQEKI